MKNLKDICLVTIVLALQGCGGGDEKTVSPGGASGHVGFTGTGGTNLGGQSGTASGGATGTGGATVGNTFTRADHAICQDWPECPEGIVGTAVINGATNESCGKTQGVGNITCNSCIDTRTPTCEVFVGRCYVKAVARDSRPIMTERTSALYPVANCSSLIAEIVPILATAHRLCTGSPNDGDVARTVCAATAP